MMCCKWMIWSWVFFSPGNEKRRKIIKLVQHSKYPMISYFRNWCALKLDQSSAHNLKSDAFLHHPDLFIGSSKMWKVTQKRIFHRIYRKWDFLVKTITTFDLIHMISNFRVLSAKIQIENLIFRTRAILGAKIQTIEFKVHGKKFVKSF